MGQFRAYFRCRGSGEFGHDFDPSGESSKRGEKTPVTQFAVARGARTSRFASQILPPTFPRSSAEFSRDGSASAATLELVERLAFDRSIDTMSLWRCSQISCLSLALTIDFPPPQSLERRRINHPPESETLAVTSHNRDLGIVFR